jgi:hypothetical protein
MVVLIRAVRFILFGKEKEHEGIDSSLMDESREVP